MNKNIYWIIAAILIFGTSVITSCSNDESSAKYDASASVEQSKTLGNTLNKVRNDMGSIDFQGLAPLASGLKQGTATISCSEMDSLYKTKFCESLKSLLEGLCGSGDNNTPAQAWQLGDLYNTLQSALDISLIFEKLAGNNVLNNGGYNKSFDIVLNDTLTYTVAFEKHFTVETTTTSLAGNLLRKLTISKNGSALLTIDTTQDNTAQVADNKFGFAAAKTGTLSYDDKKFTFERQREGYNTFVNSLTYISNNIPMVNIKTKSDNNLSWENFVNRNVVFKGNLEINLIGTFVGIVSDVSDLNKFYALGLAMGGFSIAGTTKDNCQKYTDQFNDVVDSHITMIGMDCGSITFEPALRDSTSNTYVPSLMLTDLQGEKVPIKEALESLGITFENIMSMLLAE